MTMATLDRVTYQDFVKALGIMCHGQILRCRQCGEWPNFKLTPTPDLPPRLNGIVSCACGQQSVSQDAAGMVWEQARFELLCRLGRAWCEKDKVKT